jgi:hypothetical protein
LCKLELWGLDETGNFRKIGSKKSSFSITSMLGLEKINHNILDLIQDEMENVINSVEEERENFRTMYTTEREKSKRLLFLFQKDLLPGINGQILDSKERRDIVIVKGVSRTAKLLGWTFLAFLDGGMLFYVLLFALSQTTARQNAWARSFGLWLVTEVIFVSTIMVWLMHILIPTIVMKEVGTIKEKLLDSVASYYQQLSKETLYQPTADDPVNREDEKNDRNSNKPFNAAKYLFSSYRLARDLPDLKVSKMIAQFSTPWPRQSYHHVTDVSKEYDRKFSAISRSVSIVALFFLTNLLSVPLAMQDMIMQMVSTTAIGYTMLLHIQLYHIYPVLVIIPALLICCILHFIVRSTQVNGEVEQRMFLQRKVNIPVTNNIVPTHEVASGTVRDEIVYSGDVAVHTRPGKGSSLAREDDESEEEEIGVKSNQLRAVQHVTRRQSVAHGVNIAHRAARMMQQHHQHDSEEEQEEQEEEEAQEEEHIVMVEDFDDDDDDQEQVAVIPPISNHPVIRSYQHNQDSFQILFDHTNQMVQQTNALLSSHHHFPDPYYPTTYDHRGVRKIDERKEVEGKEMDQAIEVEEDKDDKEDDDDSSWLDVSDDSDESPGSFDYV